jgi:3-hydroxyisobutyrate dehydrogenase
VKKISLIGCGKVGRCYAQALAQAGHTLVALCDQRPDDWVRESDLVISAVFGGGTLDTATRALPLMKEGAIYADFTTATPAHMQETAALAQKLNIGFVDVAILGTISATHSLTALICAGRQVEEAQQILSTLGAPVKVVSTHAGNAATLKLLRSILTKGLEALSVECLPRNKRGCALPYMTY